MENQPNQPTPQASASQPTTTNNTSKAASSATGSPAAGAERSKPTPTATTDSKPLATTTSPSGGATARTDSQRPADNGVAKAKSETPETSPEKSARPQSWMSLSSWLENPEQLTQSVKDLTASVKDLSGKATEQFNKLTTTQKVVGGALLVSGLSWLALRSKSAPKGESRTNTDYRSRPYGAASKSADQRFQGPYGNSASRGISDDYPSKSSKQYSEDETSGFGEADYSTDL